MMSLIPSLLDLLAFKSDNDFYMTQADPGPSGEGDNSGSPSGSIPIGTPQVAKSPAATTKQRFLKSGKHGRPR